MAEGFKKGLKEYYPEAQIVGEDYHKLFLTDFAPYLTKIKASGAEVVYTGDWIPDAANLLKQARQMGITLPFAHIFLDEPNFLHEVGVEGTKGLVQLSQYGDENPAFKTPEQIKYLQDLEQPVEDQMEGALSTPGFSNTAPGTSAPTREQTYWLLSVIERAGSTDPEKIIKVWEGDTYQYHNGKIMKMRACDHKAIQDLHIFEFVPPEQQKVSFNIPPYYWFQGTSSTGPTFTHPGGKGASLHGSEPGSMQREERLGGITRNAWRRDARSRSPSSFSAKLPVSMPLCSFRSRVVRIAVSCLGQDFNFRHLRHFDL